MALKFHLFSSKTLPQPPKFQPNHLPTAALLSLRPKFVILCAKRNLSDSDLSLDLATEVAKRNALLVQREEAMKKSRELLFTELCGYLALREEELKRNWRQMGEEDRWVLVKGFVSDWGANFHPLSVRSVKEMVEEYLLQEKPSSDSSSSVLFPGLKRIMGVFTKQE